MDHSLFTFTRQYWRSRKTILEALGAASVLIFYLGVGMEVFDHRSYYHLLFILGSAVAVVGALFMSQEEHDPARSFLYQLPISRRRIFLIKVGNSTMQWLAVILPLLLLMMVFNLGSVDASQNRHLNTLEFIPFYILPLWGIAALFIYLLHSTIVALALTAAAGIPVVTMLVFPMKRAAGGHEFNWLIGMSLLLAALIAGAFYLIFTRSAVHERSGRMRSMIALVAAVAIVETAFTLFMTGWRDLLFIVTGL